MRTVPATAAVDLPGGVDRAAVVWDETLGPWRYTAKALARGCRLRLADVEGDACAQVLLFNALGTHERLNVADTVKVQWQAYVGRGSLLLSDQGRVLATLVDDTSECHDTFCGASASPPSVRSLLLLGAARFGLGRRDVHPCVNLLKRATVGAGGDIAFAGGAGPGAYVELRLELPCVVVLANSPHVLDDRPDRPCSPLRITAWQAAPATADDEWRIASPEATRAFENTDDFLAGHPLAAPAR